MYFLALRGIVRIRNETKQATRKQVLSGTGPQENFFLTVQPKDDSPVAFESTKEKSPTEQANTPRLYENVD